MGQASADRRSEIDGHEGDVGAAMGSLPCANGNAAVGRGAQVLGGSLMRSKRAAGDGEHQ